ncbi:MAG TPA: hypothetical protein VK897_22335 [Anaerolineales bacterium]|nr:hypothetical protein [Anaerolineales bacterium]
MNSLRLSIVFILLVSILISCSPQAAAVDIMPTQAEPTQTSIPPSATSTFTALPTETPPLTDTPAPTLSSCAVALNPINNATVPARGPFDFTWTAFTGASSYVVSIGPAGWYPTNFPVSGTTLTRYMESFPSGSTYQWSISAVNATGQEICKAGPYTFAMSADLAATPSFNISNVQVSAAESENTSSNNNSSEAQQNGSNSGQQSESHQGSSNDSYLDASFMIVADGDTEDCRLSVMYNVKINHQFTSFKLIYGLSSNAMDSSVDFTAGFLEPYPAYNSYSAVTPPLPVKNGDTVYFGISYALDIGTKSKGPAMPHSMTNCNQ